MGASRTGVLTAGPEPLSKVTVEFLVVKSVRQPKRPQGDTKKDNRMQNEHKEMMTKKGIREDNRRLSVEHFCIHAIQSTRLKL